MSRPHAVKSLPMEISNLPREVHEEFARQAEFYESKYVTETDKIPLQTEITVVSQTYTSYLENLWEIHKRTSFVYISPPPGYNSQSKRPKNQLIRNVNIQTVLEKFQKSLQEIKLQYPGIVRSKDTILDFLEEGKFLEELLIKIYASIYRYTKG